MFLQGTLSSLVAAIANIGWIGESFTHLFLVIRAVSGTEQAVAAALEAAIGVRTES